MTTNRETPVGRWAEVRQVAAADLPDNAELMEDSGWHALIAWASNPQQVLRIPDSGTGRVVQWTRVASPRWWSRHGRGRVVAAGQYSWTQDEYDEMETDVNWYLTEAGAEPRPAGYRWHLTGHVGTRYRFASELQTDGRPEGYAQRLLKAYQDHGL